MKRSLRGIQGHSRAEMSEGMSFLNGYDISTISVHRPLTTEVLNPNTINCLGAKSLQSAWSSVFVTDNLGSKNNTQRPLAPTRWCPVPISVPV
jgi:hypothetical protein